MCKQFPSCVTVHIYRLFYLLPYTIFTKTNIMTAGTLTRILTMNIDSWSIKNTSEYFDYLKLQ